MHASSPTAVAVSRVVTFASLLLAAVWFAGAAVAQDPLGAETTPPAEAPATATTPAAGEAAPQQLTQADLQAQVKKLMEDGEKALSEGDWEKALASYDPLVRAVKGQMSAQPQAIATFYTGRGRAFAGLDDPESALADFKEALQGDPNFLPALIARGNLYLEQNATELAAADFQLALEQDRRNQDALFGIGKAYVLLGGAQQAIKPLTHVLEKDDKNAEALRLRAQAYAGVGKNDEADADIKKSLSINPNDHETYMALAAILLREEKYPESVDALEMAIQNYKPKDKDSKEPFAQGYLTKAAALLEAAKKAPDDDAKTKAYEAALAECDKLRDIVGDAPIYATIRAATEYRRGVCLRLLGRLGDAVVAFTEALNLNPDLADAYYRRGICFYYMDESELAVEDFKHAGNIDYQDPKARLWEGFAYAKLGDYHEAIRAYGAAIAESDRYVPAYVNRGLAYMMLGENDKAITDFNAAVRLEPTEWTHYFKRGIAYERLGKQQKAADSFVNAVRFESNYPPAYRHAADALAALGHNQVAGEYRSKAAELEAKQKKAQP